MKPIWLPTLDVSVPLRGKGRDQRNQMIDFPESDMCGFPSPCGEKVGINLEYIYSLKAVRFYVSVPLRGKGRDQRCLTKTKQNKQSKFPSPCGEKVGINLFSSVGWTSLYRDVSVPLRGKGRDQQRYYAVVYRTDDGWVSVPLRGKGRDQPGHAQVLCMQSMRSFRPLAGKR